MNILETKYYYMIQFILNILYHLAVSESSKRLIKNGYIEVDDTKKWNLKRNGKVQAYFIILADI